MPLLDRSLRLWDLEMKDETGTQLVLTHGSDLRSSMAMPRRARVAPGGLVYHVLNRSVAGLPLFRKEADYEAFERIMIEAHERHPTRILAWCIMRTHWHFVVYPREVGK